MNQVTIDRMRDAMELAEDVSERLGGFGGETAARWRALCNDLRRGHWEEHFAVVDGRLEALNPEHIEARFIPLFFDLLGEIKEEEAT